VTYPTATEVYDPATDTWSTRAPIPAPAAISRVLANLFLGGAALGEKIYVAVSGYSGSADTLVYDTVEDKWTTMAPLVLGPTNPTGAAVGDKLYVLPLQIRGAGFESKMAALDPDLSPPWTTAGGPPTQRAAYSVAAWSAGLFAAGGFAWGDVADAPAPTGTVEAYDVLGGGIGDPYTPTPLAAVEEGTCAY
jgi:hypothetical protein